MKIKVNINISELAIDDLTYESLTQGSEYDVIGIAGDYYRIVDDHDEPTLYRKDLFEIVDSKIPSNWVKTIFDGETFLEPPETCRPGFYEDYFDGVPYAIDSYKKLLTDLGINKKRNQ